MKELPVHVSYFQMQTLDEVPDVANDLSRYFTDIQSAKLGLFELLVNAIEHGNLEIGYAEKARLLAAGAWAEEVIARAADPRYSARRISISVAEHAERNVVAIADEGKGFDWSQFLSGSLAPDRVNGRGLYIAQRCGFHALAFSPRGNQVKCIGGVQDQWSMRKKIA